MLRRNPNIIRSKIDTKLGQQLKKKPKLVTPNELFLANLDGISEQLDKLKISSRAEVEDRSSWSNSAEVYRSTIAPGTNSIPSGPIVQVNQEIDEIVEFDEERGKYIGSGIYLKREGHLIKMTTPTFSFYY